MPAEAGDPVGEARAVTSPGRAAESRRRGAHSGTVEPVAILVDANLVLWAHHRGFDQHEAARDWWSRTVSEVPVVGIPWPTVVAFLRISTHPRAFAHPLAIGDAWAVVDGWLARPNVRCPVATERHPAILAELLVAGRASGAHTSDAHLAALAIEWGLELVSADRDFARYPGLRWHDPLAPTP